ncbi:acyl-CoA dehydrogenase domain-containing protein [Mycolicibacterium rhodesiae JS60]|nr:acyl-CoA dehydrogenase domain-containing protein [Mycolicibacterium rhodesiae JS60]
MNEREDELRELAGALAGLEPSAIDDQLVDLGLIGIGIPEADGGSGGSLSDLLVIVEEFAAQAISTSLLDASCAQWVLHECGLEVDFTTRSTLKLLNGIGWDNENPQVITEVPWASQSARVVVVDAVGSVWALDTTKVTIEPALNVAGEPRDTLIVDAHAAEELGRIDVAVIGCRLGLLRSAALLGAATAVHRITKQHVRDRQQFGAPLLRIPAVATQLAVAKTLVLQMQTALRRAVRAYESREPAQALTAVAIARVMATSSAGDVARIGHQLHGAIGTTEEHHLHRATRPLWAWRDDDGLPWQWQEVVGRAALHDGEPAIWQEITAPT